jgi:hypothetical protein
MQREMLTDNEVAKLLHVSVWTLRSWRCKGKGPTFIKISNRCRYSPRSVTEFLAACPTGGAAAVRTKDTLAAHPEGKTP